MLIYLELLIPIIIGIAYITLAERKIMASIQRRIGPNIIGIYGLLQPISDGLKLVMKETILPQKSNYYFFLIAPIYTFLLSLIIWWVIPFNLNTILFDNDYSLLYILAISSLSIYGTLYAGWSSNSKYSFIGSLRATSQLISYEISIGLLIFNILLVNNSFSLIDIIKNQIYIYNFFPLFVIFILLFISLLAETNRTPFDLLEAESELVGGFITEYSSIVFAAFYLAEYNMIIFMSLLLIILFFGQFPMHWSLLIMIFLFIWIRATLPRVKYNQLIDLGWTKILPLSISFFIFLLSTFYLLDLS